MIRREFIRSLLGLGGALAAGTVVRASAALAPARRRLLIQTSPVAGFQFHDGEAVWARLRVGDALSLVRDAGNEYDDQAVRVNWNGCRLGFVPAADNTAVAQMLDRGERLDAWIVRLERSWDPWERVEFAVEAVG